MVQLQSTVTMQLLKAVIKHETFKDMKIKDTRIGRSTQL